MTVMPTISDLLDAGTPGTVLPAHEQWAADSRWSIPCHEEDPELWFADTPIWSGDRQGAMPRMSPAEGVPGGRNGAFGALGSLGRRALRARRRGSAEASAWPTPQVRRCVICNFEPIDLIT